MVIAIQNSLEALKSLAHKVGFLTFALSVLVAPLTGLAANKKCSHNLLIKADSDAAASSWNINLISYDSKAEADLLVFRLMEKNFFTVVIDVNERAMSKGAVNGGEQTRYLVRMTGFVRRNDAVGCRLLLKERTNIQDGHILIVPPSQSPIQPQLQEVKQEISESNLAEANRLVLSEGYSNEEVSAKLSAKSSADINNLSLQQAVSFGLANNVQYREQISQIPILDLDVDAAYDPFTIKSRMSSSSSQRVGSEIGRNYQINFNKKFTTGTNVGIGASTARFAGQSLSEVTLSLSQPLLKGRGWLVNTIGIMEAEQNSIRMRNLVEHQKQQLMLNIITVYYRTVMQLQSIRIHEATIIQSKSMLASSRAKFRFGMVSRMDVFRAELQLLEAQESLESAQGAYEKYLDDLKLLIGVKLNDEIKLLDTIRFQQSNIGGQKALTQQALMSSHELANLKIERDLLMKKISVAKNNLLPQLDLTLQVSQIGTAATFSKSTRFNDSRIGIGISGTPDFNMAAEQAQYKRQLLAYENAKNRERQMEEMIQSGIKERIRQVNQGEKQVELRRRKEEAADKQKQYALVRYKKGLVDNSTVVDAEKSLVTAKIGYLHAISNYNIAVYSLYKETGQLSAYWQTGQ